MPSRGIIEGRFSLRENQLQNSGTMNNNLDSRVTLKRKYDSCFKYSPIILPALLFGFSIYSLRSGFTTGLIGGGDIPLHWCWTKLVADSNFQDFSLRGWNSHQWNGMAFFYFYGPLPHYFTAFLSKIFFFVDFNLVFNATVIVTHALLPVTVYIYVQKEFNKLSASMAALFSFFIQEQFGGIAKTVISWGIWPNAFALTFFPIVLWSLSRLCKEWNRENMVIFVLIYTLGTLTHTLFGMIFLPWIVIVYLGTYAYMSHDPLNNAMRIVFIIVTCLLITCFYWGSALLKSEYIGSYLGSGCKEVKEVLKDIHKGYFLQYIILILFFIGSLIIVRKKILPACIVLLFTIFIYTGLINLFIKYYHIEWFTPLSLLRPNDRFSGYAALLALTIAAHGTSHILKNFKGRYCILPFLIAIFLLPAVWKSLQSYYRTGNGMNIIQRKNFETAELVLSMLPHKERVAVELSWYELSTIFGNPFFLRQYLSANGINIIDGDADENPMFGDWTDSISEYKTFKGENLYYKALNNGVKVIVACSSDFKSHIEATPEYFESIGTVDSIKIFRVKGETTRAGAVHVKPILVFTTLKRWKDKIKNLSNTVYKPFLVKSNKQLSQYTQEELNQFESVVLDEPQVIPNSLVKTKNIFYTNNANISTILEAKEPQTQTKPAAKYRLKFTASYYKNKDWQGEPAIVKEQRAISFDSSDKSMPPPIRGVFSAKWEGTVSISEDSICWFNLTSDDGSWLYIDEKLVIDNGGNHSAKTMSQYKHLTKGEHKIEVRYYNALGDAVILFEHKLLNNLTAVLQNTPNNEQGELIFINDFTQVYTLQNFPFETPDGIKYSRIDPKKIQIEVGKGIHGVLVKESFFPNWRGYLNGKKINGYMAIPNFIYFPVNEAGTLIVKFGWDMIDGLSSLISLITVILFSISLKLKWWNKLPTRA